MAIVFILFIFLLASQQLADTMLFSTSWYDEMPFISASQFQMSWSLVHKVNMLAADIHHPQIGKKGSGIYIGSKTEFEVINNIDRATRLLVASLPIKSPSTAHCPMNSTILEVAQKASSIKQTDPMNYLRFNLDMQNVSKFKVEATNVNVAGCENGVCCTLDYQMDLKTINESK